MKEEIKPGYTRVSSILSPFSRMDKINPQILSNAANRGTRVHLAADAILADVGFPFEEQDEGYIESFKLWVSGKEFIERPSRLYDDEHMITGDLDLLYKNEDGITLVDLKTSANESKSWMLQGSAYSYMAKKLGYNITKIEFVKLNKQGKQPKVFTYEENFALFCRCIEVYNYFFKNYQDPIEYDYI